MDSKNFIGFMEPWTTFQWRPTTLPLKSNSWTISQAGSLAPQSNIKYSCNSKTTMQHDKEALKALTSSIDLPPIGAGASTAANDIGELTEKMQTTTLSAKSRKTADDGDAVWLPQMDGINVVLPSSSLATNQSSSSLAALTTDHEVKMTVEMLKTEKCIDSVLYGPEKSKRLPVFEEICPSSLFSDTEKPELANLCQELANSAWDWEPIIHSLVSM